MQPEVINRMHVHGGLKYTNTGNILEHILIVFFKVAPKNIQEAGPSSQQKVCIYN